MPYAPTSARIVLIATIFSALSSGIASAQKPAHHTAPFPIVDLIPTYTRPAAPFALVQGPYRCLDLGWRVTLPLTSRFSASVERVVGGTLDQPQARYIIGTGPHFPGAVRDVAIVERLDDRLGTHATLEAGLLFRHRTSANAIANLGAGGDSHVSDGAYPYTVNSTEQHYGYLGLTYATGPLRALANVRFVATVNALAQAVDHHVTTFDRASRSVVTIDERPATNRYYETNETIATVLPIPGPVDVVVTVKEQWGATGMYENSPFPYRYAISTYQVTRRIDPALSITARATDQHQMPQGAPYAAPNAAHVAAFDLFLDWRIDTSRFARP